MHLACGVASAANRAAKRRRCHDAVVCAGADTFVTGEGSHHTYHEALELGITLVYAGHYATDTLGVRALAERVAERFGVEHMFFDVPPGL